MTNNNNPPQKNKGYIDGLFNVHQNGSNIVLCRGRSLIQTGMHLLKHHHLRNRYFKNKDDSNFMVMIFFLN